jgi:hypothetical protein
LNNADGLLRVALFRVWAEWRSALKIFKRPTASLPGIVRLRRFWTWKVRRGKPGRPAVSRDIRELIRRMSRQNPGWGAPRIHVKLLKLGIDIGETSVSKYLVRSRATLTDPANVLGESSPEPHFRRLLHRVYRSVSDPVRVPRAGARA